MKRSRYISSRYILVLLFACMMGESWAADPGGTQDPPMLERVLERHAARLGLEEASLAEIKRLTKESESEIDALRDAVRSLQQDMRGLLSDDVPDEEAVMVQVERIGAAESELQKLRLRTMLQIRAVLTAEQRTELVAIHEEQRLQRQHDVAEACGPEIAEHCRDADPGEKTFDCLRRHRLQLSTECRAACKLSHLRSPVPPAE